MWEWPGFETAGSLLSQFETVHPRPGHLAKRRIWLYTLPADSHGGLIWRPPRSLSVSGGLAIYLFRQC